MGRVRSETKCNVSHLKFEHDGAQRFHAVIGEADLQTLRAVLAALPVDRAGVRLHGVVMLTAFLASSGAVGAVAASVLGDACRPVRAILFEKTPATNWSLGWHQDRTIAVKERLEVVGFGPWTSKRGMLHVQPPFDLLTRMVTLRLHLDRVTKANAPLLVAPGSHRLGKIAQSEVSAVVERCGSVACLAEPGDVWLYSTPILHASDSATAPGHRRVLQVDYVAGDLPGGLSWLGI